MTSFEGILDLCVAVEVFEMARSLGVEVQFGQMDYGQIIGRHG